MPVILTTPFKLPAVQPVGYSYFNSSTGNTRNIAYIDVGENFGNVISVDESVFSGNATYYDNEDYSYDPNLEYILRMTLIANTTTYYTYNSSTHTQIQTETVGTSFPPYFAIAFDTVNGNRIYYFRVNSNILVYTDYPVVGGPVVKNTVGTTAYSVGVLDKLAYDPDTDSLWSVSGSTFYNISVADASTISSFAGVAQAKGIVIKNGKIYAIGTNTPQHVYEYTKTGTFLQQTSTGLNALLPNHGAGGALFNV